MSCSSPGRLALVLSPATVSAQVLRSEAIVLSVGLTAISGDQRVAVANRLDAVGPAQPVMCTIDLRRPGQRLPVAGSGVVAELIHTFNAMLARLEAERSASTGRVLAAQETERQRIGRELHDEVGQMLTVVLLGLQQAGHRAPPDLAADLQSLQDSTRTSLDEVRRIAGRLRPGMLENLGLVSSLNALATEFTSHTEVRVRRGFAPGLPQMSRETELVIYLSHPGSTHQHCPACARVHGSADSFSSRLWGDAADSRRRRRHARFGGGVGNPRHAGASTAGRRQAHH